MDQKQDYKEKYEKRKIHTIYLWIIAGILAVASITFVLGGNENALGQISMASSVSSIILSSIAIFMSISGENKLNYTHDKLVETSDRMSGITANIEQANNLLNDTVSRIAKIDDISDRLERIGKSVFNVEKEILGIDLRANEKSNVNITKDTLWQVYVIMSSCSNEVIRTTTMKLIEYFIVYYSSKLKKINIQNMVDYLSDGDLFDLGLCFGILCVYRYIGIIKPETIKYFEQNIDLSQEKRDKIGEFL